MSSCRTRRCGRCWSTSSAASPAATWWPGGSWRRASVSRPRCRSWSGSTARMPRRAVGSWPTRPTLGSPPPPPCSRRPAWPWRQPPDGGPPRGRHAGGGPGHHREGRAVPHPPEPRLRHERRGRCYSGQGRRGHRGDPGVRFGGRSRRGHRRRCLDHVRSGPLRRGRHPRGRGRRRLADRVHHRRDPGARHGPGGELPARQGACADRSELPRADLAGKGQPRHHPGRDHEGRRCRAGVEVGHPDVPDHERAHPAGDRPVHLHRHRRRSHHRDGLRRRARTVRGRPPNRSGGPDRRDRRVRRGARRRVHRRAHDEAGGGLRGRVHGAAREAHGTRRGHHHRLDRDRASQGRGVRGRGRAGGPQPHRGRRAGRGRPVVSPGGARAALWHGAAAFGVLLVLGEVVALLRAAGPLDPTAGAVLRAGALAPSFVHRVPVEMLLVDASGPGGLFGGAVEAGFLVVVALHPNATRAFLDSAGARGWAGAAAVLLVTALLLPNAGIGAAVAAMGVPIELRAGESTCVLITLGEPTCGEVSLDVAPGYLLYVVVPLAATLSGGWWAARRRGSRGGGAAGPPGAAAGALFAPIVVALAYLASVGYRFAGPLGGALGEGGVSLGPPLVPTFLAALAWGVVGGIAGGLAARRFGRGSGPGGWPGPQRIPRGGLPGGGGGPPPP